MAKKKILIIEDDKYIAELERDYLEANGYSVKIEIDGMNGADTAISEDFSLVILDIMLPGMDGFDVCRALRREKDIPVLMVTARTEEIDKIRGFGLGADDYIVKPFSPSELVARVNSRIVRYEQLTAKNTSVSDVITSRGLSIDRSARRVFIDGEETVLTNKEFDLLAFLAQSPNVVFSKQELFDKIWGKDAVGEISTVTVHINRIREKIEKQSDEKPFIETVWGVGYRFRG